MKYLLSVLLFISFNANAIVVSEYIGQWWSTAYSQDKFRFQCAAGSKSATLRMNITDLQPIDYAEVDSSLSKGGTTSVSGVLRFKMPYNGTNGAWGNLTYINNPYITGNPKFMWAQVEKSERFPGDISYIGPFTYYLDIQCRSGLNGTGSVLSVTNLLWTQSL